MPAKFPSSDLFLPGASSSSPTVVLLIPGRLWLERPGTALWLTLLGVNFGAKFLNQGTCKCFLGRQVGRERLPLRFLSGASCFLVSVPAPWSLCPVLLFSSSDTAFHGSYLLRNNAVDTNHSPSLFLSSTSQSSSSEKLPGCLPLFCPPRVAQQTLFQGVGCLLGTSLSFSSFKPLS